MSLRSKVFEFSAGQAPTVTIGHVWSIFSNLDASTSCPVWHLVLSRSTWCWHKLDTQDAGLMASAMLVDPQPFG